MLCECCASSGIFGIFGRGLLHLRPGSSASSTGVSGISGNSDSIGTATAAGVPLPDVTRDPLGWFDHFDTAGSGWLSQEQVVRALVKTYGTDPADTQRTRERVVAIWPVFVGFRTHFQAPIFVNVCWSGSHGGSVSG